MSWRLVRRRRAKRVAIFVSKTDHCLYDLLLRHRAGELRCEIPLIVSNHPDLEPIARAVRHPLPRLPDHAGDQGASRRRASSRCCDEQRDRPDRARPLHADPVAATSSARYPDRASSTSTTRSCRPSAAARPYHQAHERGVKLIGATAHYATVDLDEGPIIEQDVIRVSHRDSVEDLVRKGRDVERIVLSRAVRWHLEDRVLVYGNKTVVFA